MFSKLIGNLPVKQTLKRLVISGRIPNAMLLAGPEGVGKRLFAIEIARAMLCPQQKDGEGCGVCTSCVRIGTFSLPTSDTADDYKMVFFSENPDVGMVVPFKRNIAVDAIRDLEREAHFSPFEAKARFFIIDDAHKMNPAAANALLKTLEEPAETSHIFLISSRPDSFLPTIRSRCQMLRFGPAARSEIEEYLIDSLAFSHDEARLAAAVSHGSVANAVAVDVEKYRMRSQRMLDVVRNALVVHDLTALLRVSDELNDAKNKDDLEANLDILEFLLHDIWILDKTRDTERISNREYAAELTSIAASASAGTIQNWLASIAEMRKNFVVNVNRKAALDAMLAKAGFDG